LLSLTLSQNAEVTATGGQITTAPLYFPLDANGKITTTAIWFNDELSPSGTVYRAQLYGSNGCTLIQDFGYWSIAGASADLSTMIPASLGGPSVAGAVLLNPSGNQTITTGNLTLAAGKLISGNVDNIFVVDGVANTTIAAAITAATATGGEVYIPPGNYTISASISIPSNITLRGAGRGITTLTTTGTNFDVFKNAGATNSSIIIRDLTVNAASIVSGVGRTAYFKGVTKFEISGCEFLNSYDHGVWCDDGCAKGRIHGNIIDTIAIGSCILLGNGPLNALVNDIEVTDNYCANSLLADGIFCIGSKVGAAYGTARLTIKGNIIVGCHDTSIECSTSCQDVSIVNNTVLMPAVNGTTGISNRSGFGINISGNVVFGTNNATQICYLIWNQAGDNTINQNSSVTGNIAYNAPTGYKVTCPAAGLDNLILANNKQFNCATPYSFSGNETNLFRLLNDDGIIQTPSATPLLIDATNSAPRVQKSGGPTFLLRDLAQSITAGGLWRIGSSGAAFSLDMNTAAGGDFSTSATPINVDASSNVFLSQGPLILRGTDGFQVRNGLLGRWFSDAGVTLKAQIDGSVGDARLRRIKANIGTAYSGADAAIVLSAGWGTTATKSAATGTDQAFAFIVNSSGTGQLANPTITITWKDGTWTNNPIVVVLRNDIISPFNTPPHTWAATATTLTITMNGTPVAGNSYTYYVHVIGL